MAKNYENESRNSRSSIGNVNGSNRNSNKNAMDIRVKTKQKMNMTGKKTGTKTDFLIWDAACAASLFI